MDGLRLLHPFMPFVTEELWQRLPRRRMDATPTIVFSTYPAEEAKWKNEQIEQDVETVEEIIHGVRSLSASYNIRQPLQAYVVTADEKLKSLVQEYEVSPEGSPLRSLKSVRQ